MERPMMNPRFMDGAPPPPVRKSTLRRFWDLLTLPVRILLLDVRFWKRGKMEMEDGPAWQRLLRGMVYRMLLTPVLLVLLIAGLVYQGTHPPTMPAMGGPVSLGTHVEPLDFAAEDGVALNGWVVPVIDARSIIASKETLLRKRHPGVVLVHDQDGTREQMLPLVRPLHEQGYVVLVTSLRSSGPRPVQTFGLRESADVRAAVEALGRRSDVDPSRIAVVGVGTGANAAMLAAGNGAPIKALVLDRPLQEPAELISNHLGLPQPWLQWMRPGFRWTFELAYRVNSNDIDPRRHEKMLQSKPVLMIEADAENVFRTAGLERTRQFLAQHLAEASDVARTDP